MRLRAFRKKEPDHERVRRHIVGVLAGGPAAQDRFNQIYCRFRKTAVTAILGQPRPACRDDWLLAWLEARIAGRGGCARGCRRGRREICRGYGDHARVRRARGYSGRRALVEHSRGR